MPDERFPIHPEMDPVLIELGRLASAWSSLEYMIQRGIWEIANVEQYVGACITAQIIPPSGKCRAYIALVNLFGPDKKMLGKLNRFASRVEAKARVRNRYIHDPWTYNQTQKWAARLEVSADKKLTYGPVRTDPEELDRFRTEVCDLIESFQILHAEVLSHLPPTWSRTRFAQSAGIAMLSTDQES